MIHLKRFLWLAAWGVWIWLGFGLYRELPRELESAVCQIPFPSDAMTTYGFDGPSRLVVVDDVVGGLQTVSLFDAENGARIAQFPTSKKNLPGFRWFQIRMGHRHVLFQEALEGALHDLDLVDGACRTIRPKKGPGWCVHPTKPLVAFIAFTDDPKRPTDERLVVYDLETHRLLFDTIVTGRKLEFNRLFFIPGTDKLFMMRSIRGGSGATTIFICTMPRPGAQSKVEVLEVGFPRVTMATTSRNGRVVFGGGDTPAFAVFDFTEDREVFSRSVPLDEWHKGTRFSPTISATGRTVLSSSVVRGGGFISSSTPTGGWPQTLWDLETGVPLWRAPSSDFAEPDSSFADLASVGTRFVVHENRGSSEAPRTGFHFPNTLAFRDARDGSLLFRMWARLTDPREGQFPESAARLRFNADWTLGVSVNGLVYRFPPRVNYPLLLLCQTILALPLILLWAILRWRRKKKAMLASSV